MPLLWDLMLLFSVSSWHPLVDVTPLLFFFKKIFSNLLAFLFFVYSVQNQTVLLTAPWGL